MTEIRRKPLKKIGWIVLVALLLLAGAGVYFWVGRNQNKWMHLPSLGIRVPLKYDIHGIDISHHNGNINWSKVRAMKFSDDLRLQFVFVKATEGTSLSDSDFKKNWQKADEVGLYRGAYHFFIPWKTPEPQAEQFLKTVTLEKGDLPPVLDFEIGTTRYSREQVTQNVAKWLEIVEQHYGCKPIIYTNANFYKNYIQGNLDDYPLWIADYSGWSLNRYDSNANILFWQHSKSATIAGIFGEVDFNTFLGDADDLKNLTIDK